MAEPFKNRVTCHSVFPNIIENIPGPHYAVFALFGSYPFAGLWDVRRKRGKQYG